MSIDKQLAFFAHMLPESFRERAATIALLGEPGFHALFWPCLALFIRKRPYLFLGLTHLLAGSSVKIIKALAGRSRPALLFNDNLFEWVGFSLKDRYHSFPSGHAVAAFALAFALSHLFPRAKMPLFVTASLVSVSRLILLEHFFTDVLGGALLAFIATKVALFLTQTYGALWIKDTPTTPSIPSS